MSWATWRDWSAEDVERLKVLWSDGLIAAEIAAKLSRSRNAVIGKVHRLDLGPHGMQRVREKNYDWTEEQIADLRRLRAEGLSVAEIAGRLGISHSAVRGKILRLGMPGDVRRSRPALVPPRKPAPVPISAPFVEPPSAGTGTVLFVHRAPLQCAWPDWSGLFDVATSRCCGLPVDDDGGRPYCAGHRQISGSAGTPSERRALDSLRRVA